MRFTLKFLLGSVILLGAVLGLCLRPKVELLLTLEILGKGTAPRRMPTISPSGTLCYFTDYEDTLHVYNLYSGAEIRQLKLDASGVMGPMIEISSNDQWVRIITTRRPDDEAPERQKSGYLELVTGQITQNAPENMDPYKVFSFGTYNSKDGLVEAVVEPGHYVIRRFHPWNWVNDLLVIVIIAVLVVGVVVYLTQRKERYDQWRQQRSRKKIPRDKAA